jgi:hypothetical protein
MRFMLTLAAILLLGMPGVPLLAHEAIVAEPGLLRLKEFPTAGHNRLMQLKILRYNAHVRALESATTLYVNGKTDLPTLADAGGDVTDSALALYTDPRTRIQCLQMHVEFAEHLQRLIYLRARTGPFSRLEITQADANLYDAQVKLLEAQQRLQSHRRQP